MPPQSRHVRLSKDFVNVDVSKDGRSKLRIPIKLYLEKKRTQNRFNVRAPTMPRPPVLLMAPCT